MMADEDARATDGSNAEQGSEEMPVSLGPCHYDNDEQAVTIAVDADGVGWISICEEHKQRAADDGYQPHDAVRAPGAEIASDDTEPG
jgi:hypothetical protein